MLDVDDSSLLYPARLTCIYGCAVEYIAVGALGGILRTHALSDLSMICSRRTSVCRQCNAKAVSRSKRCLDEWKELDNLLSLAWVQIRLASRQCAAKGFVAGRSRSIHCMAPLLSSPCHKDRLRTRWTPGDGGVGWGGWLGWW